MSWKGQHHAEGCYSKADYVSLAAITRDRDRKRFSMRKRLAKRDRDYAGSPCAAPVTVEMRDLRNSELGQIMRIETRGFCPIASNCNHLTHL